MSKIKTEHYFSRLKHITPFEILNIIILSLLAFICLYPFYNVCVYAFNDGMDSLKGALYLWPRQFTFSNFYIAFSQNGILNAFKISIIRTVLGTLLSLVCISSLAYAMTKRLMPGYKAISYFMIITFLFSGGMIPFFLTIKELGLYDNFLVFIIPGLYSYWYMIIFRSFFESIPYSIEESAKIDGASYLKIFTSLIVPLSMPVFAAISLYIAVYHWNEWFSGLFYIKRSSLIPLQTLLQQLMIEADMTQRIQQMTGGIGIVSAWKSVTPYAIRLAIIVITVAPIVLVYPFLQKYIVKGILIGSVKG